mmetsp:Transcript_41004/g.102432  ORF Transcript_41004/g.102432 Transcript_41004/m.102432 type:complete len:270 (+) Transcript_41004:1045-1854(+)
MSRPSDRLPSTYTAFTISIWFASYLVDSLNEALKEFHGDQEKVMLDAFVAFFSKPPLKRTGIVQTSQLLLAERLQIAIKKALEGDSIPERTFLGIAWAYTTMFLLTVPFIGLLYLTYATSPYEKALCIIGILYITVGAVFFLGIIGPVIRASRIGEFRRELCILPADAQAAGDLALKCFYGWSGCWARCLLPIASCICDLPGLLYTHIRLRKETDEEKRKGLEKMRGFFFCASLVSAFAAVVVFCWVAILLWRDEVLEASITVQEAVGD